MYRFTLQNKVPDGTAIGVSFRVFCWICSLFSLIITFKYDISYIY